MFGTWCNTAVLGGMIYVLYVLTHKNMFQTRDTEQKVQL